MALEHDRSEVGRGNVQLLSQHLEVRQSEQPGPSPWPAFANTDSKVLYLDDPITVGGVANINCRSPMTSRGMPFA